MDSAIENNVPRARHNIQQNEDPSHYDAVDAYLNHYTDVNQSQPLVEAHDEDKPDKVQEMHADPRRLYILLVFSFLTFTQGGVWNTWGSISASAECAFGWEDSTFALLSNWGPITYIISTVFFSWLCDVKGLRIASLVTAVLVASGCGLRCITSTPPASTWLIHAGQIMNGFGGPVAMGGPPLVSATWFPVHERTKSTAFGCIMNGLGVAVSFIIAPLLVPDVDPKNCTLIGQNVSYNETVHHIRESIMFLMYIEFAWAGLLLLMIVIYYPSKPKIAPSVTATLERVQFKASIISLLKNKKFWMLSVPYAISCGVYFTWASIFDVILKAKGVDEDTAGWVAFWMTVAAQVIGMTVGIFADIFARRMKIMIVCLYVVAFGALLTFSLMYVGVFQFSTVMLYVSNIIAGAAIGGSPPLLYELVCESTFPVSEGITNLFMTCLNNCAGLLFLTMPMIFSGTTWMNWVVVSSIVVCVPIFALFPEKYTRFDIDTENENRPQDIQNQDDAES